MRKPRIGLRDRGNCFVGEVEFPLEGGGSIKTTSVGWSPAAALRRASSFATSVLTNPYVAPFVPPQATAAVQAARGIARTAERSIDELRRAAPAMPSAQRKLAKGVVKQTNRAVKRYATSSASGAGVRPRAHQGTYAQPGAAAPATAYPDASSPGVVYPPGAQPPGPYYPTPEQQPYPTEYPGGGGYTSPEEAFARQAWGDHNFAEGAFPYRDDYSEVDEESLYEDPANWEYDDGASPELVEQEDYWSDEES